MKPCDTRERGASQGAASGDPVESAITAAWDYVLAKQSADGAWRDFLTEPGLADSWTTAYVGLCLLAMPRRTRSEHWQPALSRAATWLRAPMERVGGWGYNAKRAPDADSTAHAILFLRHCDVEVPIEVYSKLLAFARPDGGFATYRTTEREGSYGISHPCVTPVAVHAMLSCLAPGDPRLAKSLEYIRSGQTAAGTWNSFWWETPLYSTAVNLEAVIELGLAFDRRTLSENLLAQSPTTPFELSLLARCLLLLGRLEDAKKAIGALLRFQEADGSWPSSPILRLTRFTCFEPWNEPDPGPLYPDQERLFTTATALKSLANWHSANRNFFHAAGS